MDVTVDQARRRNWAGRAVFPLVFALTGFSSLTLQVVWQRVISMHSGVDLVSFTTVVAAFLAGLGIGSLLGGWLADRLGPRRSIAAFAASNLGIGVFAWFSLVLFYDVYRAQAAALSSTAATFGFNLAILLVPTTLMGLSLPLVAKAVVARIDDAGPVVGRLYSINTLGAAFGAAVTGWLLLGSLGFEWTVRLAGTLNLVAAGVMLAVYRSTPAGAAAADTEEAQADLAPVSSRSVERTWPWYLLYAASGAVALGFEVVFFRLIDTVMRSNSYSFAHVLSLYLLLFSAGAAIGSRLVGRTSRPDRWFLWIQFGVGVAALSGVVVLTGVLPAVGFEDSLQRYFAGEGFNVGFGGLEDRVETGSVLLVFGGAPLLIMTLPVLLMGASYPFIQALVSQRAATLGRRTGLLLFSNIVGNVSGTLLVSFVVIDRAGTAGTYKLLAVVLAAAGVAASLMAPTTSRRVVGVLGVGVVMALLVTMFPTNLRLWEFLHGTTADAQLLLQEDRTCGTVLRERGPGYAMTVNGSAQNDYPFDDFHVLIGLLPALQHDDPHNGMAVGLGIGATPYGMSLDSRVDSVHTVEICSGQVALLRSLADGAGAAVPQGSPELRTFLADPRVSIETGDGRRFLQRTDERFDIITVDTLRPQSAFSGSLYSTDFYELVSDRLTDDGLMAQWVPSPRAQNAAAQVFPYVVTIGVPEYFSAFMLASNSPIEIDSAELSRRFTESGISSSLLPAQAASIEEFLAGVTPTCIVDGVKADGVPADRVNTDLRPRDEYFLTNGLLNVPYDPVGC